MYRIALLVLAGCPAVGGGGGEPLTAIPELPTHQGCGDTYIYAVSADGTVQVRFTAEGAVEQAYLGTTEISWDLADATFELALETGHRLEDLSCTDYIEVIDGDQPHVDETWTAISGAVSTVITPMGETYHECNAPADAVLHLEGVVFESPDGEQLTLESLDVAVDVGWCAG